MMRRVLRDLTRLAVSGLVLCAPALAPAAIGAGAACAAGAPHAALVVDTGGSATTYCVALDASTVSGLHLIQLAGTQFGLEYRFGFGGQAVCELKGVGADGSDCFGDYPDFWGYWHGDESGGWSWAGSGAAAATIGDGDMDGWVWGTGDSGTTHAAPPALSFDDVCDVGTPPPSTSTPTPTGGGGHHGGRAEHDGGTAGSGGRTTMSTPSASPSPAPSASPPHHARSRASASAPTTVSASEPVIRVAAAGGAAADDGGGPAAAALGVALLIVGLGAGGALILRRRGQRAR